MKNIHRVLILIILSAGTLAAQTSVSNIPDGFGKIVLGMNMEEVKAELKADGNFNFRGSPDVSILRREDQSLIECRGYDFIDRALFQFKKDSLYSITILLNQEVMDHYSMFTTLTEKYGNPISLDPERSVWESETTTLTLERPLQIKYLNRKVMAAMISNGKIEESLSALSREQFLEQF